MNKPIDISILISQPIPILSDEKAKEIYKKGWSFFNVYSLRELRDIYIIYTENIGLTIAQLYNIVEQLINFEEKDWSERRVLENINALKNLKYLDVDGRVQKKVFVQRVVTSP